MTPSEILDKLILDAERKSYMDVDGHCAYIWQPYFKERHRILQSYKELRDALGSLDKELESAWNARILPADAISSTVAQETRSALVSSDQLLTSLVNEK